MAGKRTSLLSLAGEKTESIPGQSDPVLLSVTLDKLVATRFNPRRNFGTDDDLQAFGAVLAKKQLQPAVAVSRTAYLKLWPDEAVGAATHVIANGERRLRASRAVGRPTLEIVVRDDIAISRAGFLDAVLSENIDREDLNPIERAFAIETMVQELGGADAVAEHYDKTKGWVSQQRSLLKLAPDTQLLVASGEMPVRFARSITSLSPADQLVAWEQEQLEAAERALARKARATAARAKKASPKPPASTELSVLKGERFTAVNQTTDEPGQTTPASGAGPVGQHDNESAPRSSSVALIAGQRTAASGENESEEITASADPAPLSVPADDESDSVLRPALGEVGQHLEREGGEETAVAQSSVAEMTVRGGSSSGAVVIAEANLHTLPDRQRSFLLHRYVHMSDPSAIAEDFARGLDAKNRRALAQILAAVAAQMAAEN
ncbi:ParB/RepB/Spo0J family partition protein [Streptomyces gardneri]|uniref:ParB/RepB/Spo0J family partition protein n=1 Tax=Streptomyces gardneri TaxID=66892 RepID=UPI0036909431